MDKLFASKAKRQAAAEANAEFEAEVEAEVQKAYDAAALEKDEGEADGQPNEAPRDTTEEGVEDGKPQKEEADAETSATSSTVVPPKKADGNAKMKLLFGKGGGAEAVAFRKAAVAAVSAKQTESPSSNAPGPAATATSNAANQEQQRASEIAEQLDMIPEDATNEWLRQRVAVLQRELKLRSAEVSSMMESQKTLGDLRAENNRLRKENEQLREDATKLLNHTDNKSRGGGGSGGGGKKEGGKGAAAALGFGYDHRERMEQITDMLKNDGVPSGSTGQPQHPTIAGVTLKPAPVTPGGVQNGHVIVKSSSISSIGFAGNKPKGAESQPIPTPQPAAPTTQHADPCPPEYAAPPAVAPPSYHDGAPAVDAPPPMAPPPGVISEGGDAEISPEELGAVIGRAADEADFEQAEADRDAHEEALLNARLQKLMAAKPPANTGADGNDDDGVN